MNAMKDRLDKVLLEKGAFATRARARDAIKRGCVSVDGEKVSKPGQVIDSARAEITINDPAAPYVSRAALKLKHALDRYNLEVTGAHGLDIGQSTGGFTQVLLEQGANKVIGIEIGHGQLATELRSREDIETREGINARHLKPDDFAQPFSCIVCDVSFISLHHIIPAALPLAAEIAWAVFLIKPQFEVGQKNIGKNGVVSNHSAIANAIDEILKLLNQYPDWQYEHPIDSPVEGGDGNQEYLLVLRKGFEQ